jgi:peptide/nickel transport system substrate-binding protein
MKPTGMARRIAGIAIAASLVAGCGAQSSTPTAAGTGAQAATPTAAGTGAQAATPTAAAKDTLIVAVDSTPPSIDMDESSGPMTWLIAGNAYARGFEYAREPYPFTPVDWANPSDVPGYSYPNYDMSKATPGIIQSCDLSADGTTATYHLRQGVKSSAGNEFTTADIMWRLQRAVALQANGSFFMNVVNAPNLDQYKALDKYTLQITSTTAMPLICDINVHIYWWYVDSTAAKAHATADDPWAKNWLATNDAGFGPYHITDWEAGKQIVMEANPNYWAGVPKIKKVIFEVVPDAAGRLALLQAGKVDVAENLSYDEYASLKGAAGIRVIGEASASELHAVVDNSKPPFNNVYVRRAVNTAIDRDTIVSKIFAGFATAFQGPTPTVYPAAGFADRHDYDYNLTTAKALLAQGGYPNGFQVPLSYDASDPVQQEVAITIQDSLKQIGIQVTLQALPSAAIQALVDGSKAQFALWEDAAFLPDAQFVSQIMFTVAQHANYSDPSVTAQIDTGKSIVSQADRVSYFTKVQQMEYSDSPLIWIAEPDVVVAVSDSVAGWADDCFPFVHLDQMYLQ